MLLNDLVQVDGRSGEVEMIQKHPHFVIRRPKVGLMRKLSTKCEQQALLTSGNELPRARPRWK